MTETEKHLQTIATMKCQHSHIRKNDAEWDAMEAAEAALRRTAEDDKAREEGRLVELPCKPNETFLHRNYDTGALELNISLHDFDGSTRELPWEEIDQCAYWE